ncbi:MAG: DUF3795 domain-containing protein [Opitutaceae bacterium]
MKNDGQMIQSRREFLAATSKLGVACGFTCLCPMSRLAAQDSYSAVPDPKKLNYCAYVCSKDCVMKVAGESGDLELKRAAYKEWKIKERYGLEFDPDQIFCKGCKTEEANAGAAVGNCPVRKCAMERGLNGCIECWELETCDQQLWKESPSFHARVIRMQERYRSY